MKNTVLKLLTEFVMVFLGVLLAFFTSNWAERERDRKYLNTIVDNLIQDVENDSVQVIHAISNVRTQYDSLEVLISHLRGNNLKAADPYIYWTYFSYSAFDPTTETFESIVFGGDMKLVGDLKTIRSMKELDHINNKLNEVHIKYYQSVESFKNTFICHYDMRNFNFTSIPMRNRMEFWNRINFLRANVKYYYEILLVAQQNYNKFLQEIKAQRIIA